MGVRFQVPVPREALGEVSSALALTDAAAAAAPFGSGDGDSRTLETAVAVAAGYLAGTATFPGGWRGETGVRLLADWPCSCVRVMGETGAVQSAVSYEGGKRGGHLYTWYIYTCFFIIILCFSA